jgi:hypothetical protein
MREMGVGAGEAVVRLVETDKSGCILQFGSEEDLIKILQHPKSRDGGCSVTPYASRR